MEAGGRNEEGKGDPAAACLFLLSLSLFAPLCSWGKKPDFETGRVAKLQSLARKSPCGSPAFRCFSRPLLPQAARRYQVNSVRAVRCERAGVNWDEAPATRGGVEVFFFFQVEKRERARAFGGPAPTVTRVSRIRPPRRALSGPFQRSSSPARFHRRSFFALLGRKRPLEAPMLQDSTSKSMAEIRQKPIDSLCRRRRMKHSIRLGRVAWRRSEKALALSSTARGLRHVSAIILT